MVSCKDCGLLAVHNGAGLVVIAQPITREHGQNASGLCCVADACNHAKEYAEIGQPQIKDDEKWKQVIQKPRECSRFLSWKKGMELRDHWEIARMLELEKMNEDRRIKDLERADRLREDDRRFKADQDERERKWQLVRWVLAGIGSIIGAIILNKLGIK